MLLKKHEFDEAVKYNGVFYNRYCRIKKVKLTRKEWLDVMGITGFRELQKMSYIELEEVYTTYLTKLHS